MISFKGKEGIHKSGDKSVHLTSKIIVSKQFEY